MKNYRYYLFDLDGTLTDPGEGITNSVMHALAKFGITETDRTKLYKFIGPPLMESFQQFCGFTPEQAKEAVSGYREYFRDRGIFENRLYPDVPKMLERLKSEGKILAVATSKPEEFAVRILEHFQLDGWFDFVGGATMDGSRSKKKDIVRYVIDKLQVPDLKEAVMVGDREHDVRGAAENGIDCIGVLYGYGSRKELEQAGASFIAETPLEVVPL